MADEAEITLTVTSGQPAGKTFVFSERNSTIAGRGKGCEPKLPGDDKTVSRFHCLLDINPPDIRIRDFGSLNGTVVNGETIGQREKGQKPNEVDRDAFAEIDLRDGDSIRLGRTELSVAIKSPATVAETPEDSASATRDPAEVVRDLLTRAKTGQKDLVAISGYTLIRELGRGGMGAVYLAEDNESKQRVALKVMLPRVAADERSKLQFLREVECTRVLDHRNLIRLHDSGCSDSTFFFTLEYCDGGSVDQLIESQGGTLEIDDALQITLQALEGLDHAHNVSVEAELEDGSTRTVKGLVHRDLSPHNLFLSGSGSSLQVKVADFGLSKAFDTAGLSGMTRTGMAAGKPLYMPRQQVLNYKYSRPDVDVWAMAACLYNMVTGQFPRDFLPGIDPWHTVLQTEPVPVRSRKPSIPRRLAEVIDTALIDKGKLHFQSATAFRCALEEAA